MKVKTERELFEENIHPRILSWVYFCNDSNGYKFKIVNFDTDKYRALSELNFGWKMWRASASREGYKLVPVEPSEEIKDAMCGYECNTDVEIVACYEAIMGAVK